MTPNEKREIMEKALEITGKDFQLMLLVEECGELLQAIGKVYRNKAGSLENLHEEIADVQLMLDQVKLIYDEEKINEIMEQKLTRLKSRLGEVAQTDTN